MAFAFRFEKLLKLKKIRVEKLQKEFYVATSRYVNLMNQLLKLKNSRDEAILRRKNIELAGAKAPQFEVIENFLNGNKALCIKKIEEIKESKKEVDLKKRELMEASREKKIFEKLRENAYRDYRLKIEALRMNEMDEISGVYFGRAN